ncbi:SNAP receptor [Saccharomycopsis crataegensis]|uniref:SNAP receptor n=1 Tax=Saccharomycopsis crataegensis TaxID=43959 RepID=A0AAV5QFU1_9ASCO|nr:SNAP receptor [Saccharomycopsis crataegensis]
MSHNQPYDPYEPNNKINQVQQEIDDTVNIMRQNIDQVNQRGENLDSLQNQASDFRTSAGAFKSGANDVRKHFWWQNVKMKMCLIVAVIVLLIVIIVPIAVHFK